MNRTARFVLTVMTFSAALVWAAVPAQAKGFTINLFSDGKDIKPGDGPCDSNGSKSGDQCTLRGNSANNGAGLYADTTSGHTINLNIVTASGNTASAGGGGIDVEGGVKATLNRLTVTGNHAGDGGGLAAFLKTGATGSVV